MTAARSGFQQASFDGAQHLNIEPFHFPAEAVVQLAPPALPETLVTERSSGRSIPRTFAILLDDTSTPGIGVYEGEARAFVRRFGAEPCLFVLETDLVSLAWCVLRNLAVANLRVEGRYIYLAHAVRKILLFRGRRPQAVSQLLGAEFPVSESESLLATGRPSCPVYTLAWYYFRLATERQDWVELSGSPDRSALQDRIADMAFAFDRDMPAKPHSTLLTALPWFLRQNEADSIIVAGYLRSATIRALLTSEALTHKYYGVPTP